MNTVQPIRNMTTVLDIADYLRDQNERNYIMFMFGIYTGLRICDILKLKVRDVKGKNAIYMREKKTNKEKKFAINSELKKILDVYLADKKDWEYLIPSPNYADKPISRQQAYNIMSEAGHAFGIDNIGTHTLRKTFGYHMYQQTHDAVILMQIFNHSDIGITLRYIGVIQDDKDKAIRGLTFKRGR